MINHRPVAPADFGQKLGQLLVTEEPEDLGRDLRTLAKFELDYGQTIQFQHVLNRLPDKALEGFVRRRIALLSNATVDHLVPALRVAGLRVNWLVEAYVSPYQQYVRDLLDEGSALAEFNPEYVVFSLSPREFLSSFPSIATASTVNEEIEVFLTDLRTLWSTARDKLNASVLQQTFLNLGNTLYGNLDRRTPSAPAQAIRSLNQALAEQAAASDVYVLDLDRQVEFSGLSYWYDNARWLQAKIEISPGAAGHYAEQATRIIAADLGMSRKCLVLDLDNTLWGGVVGDDGIDNIVLGQGSALGEAFVQFQEYAKRLKERGIVLAVCSKNETETAEAVFRHHPEMVLDLDDIAVFVANWHDKATNVARIARQLNIGLDSLVLVDDNPAERALVRQAHPEVAVPELPSDPSDYVECLSRAGYFEAVAITGDDLMRSAQYAQNKQRQKLSQSSQTIDEYLRSLEMRMTVNPFVEVDMPRIAQLTNKTNQFNVTTRRKSLAEIREFASCPDNLTLQVRLSDRFGDNGLVSAVMLTPDCSLPHAYEIETWVMSCRVFGRELENEMLNELVKLIVRKQSNLLTGRYIPTQKNKPVRDLFERLGFVSLDRENDVTDGETRWMLNTDGYTDQKTHIDMA